jgi:hypothetical protein
MMVAMMEMRLHDVSIRAIAEVVNIFPLESLAIFWVEWIEILDGTDAWQIRALQPVDIFLERYFLL